MVEIKDREVSFTYYMWIFIGLLLSYAHLTPYIERI
jgi:hypothetical protein